MAGIATEEPPEEFVKKLSKAMFDIDLENMDVARWGHYKCEAASCTIFFTSLTNKPGKRSWSAGDTSMNRLRTCGALQLGVSENPKNGKSELWYDMYIYIRMLLRYK